jgi:putative ABC transport system ATP-binding protein
MPELKLENVSYQYKHGDRKVVDDVTCRFEGGKLNAVVGPSGSGKTTLLSLLAGLDQPDQGHIYIDNESLADLDLDQYRRERVSMIFQAFHLFPLLTALENVCFPMQLNGVPGKEIPEKGKNLLSSVGITEEKFKRYPANLSGGEQQRVAIARTLATGAHVLLADEPTGNLDKANGDKLIEILGGLAHEGGYCVIIVTHDPSIAERSDKVWRMSDGVLIEGELVSRSGG